MITKQDILKRAAQWQLRPDVVEKDYVLGWLLVGIAQHPIISKNWIFKGGTCIKKCYFETYRFSEDLDFSLLPNSPYTDTEIKNGINEVLANVSQLSGITFSIDLTSVERKANRQNQLTFKIKIAYSGPLVFPGNPRILFDITNNEPLYSDSTGKSIIHPYPDTIPQGTTILTYSLHELLAEKTRALFERTRPRDLYDVVYILENRVQEIDYKQLRDLFIKKCSSKSLKPPSAQELINLINQSEELKADWEAMLSHQLPGLPLVEDYLSRTAALLEWLDEAAAEVTLPILETAPISSGQIVNPAGIHYWSESAPLEILRFCGANRLKVQFDYTDKSNRIVEPYSLRQANTGNLLFYGWEDGESHIKAFNVAKIHNLRATNISFSPKYQVEFIM